MAERVARGLLPTLAGIVLLRVMGVSLVLAGFLGHAASLGGSTFEGGVAFGAYPLALALFMLPLGALSDRWGRRPVLVGALVVSALGGFVAAWAPTMPLLVAGRFLQGAGAVNGVALALVGEAGAPERRTSRMAVLGAAAGVGFALGLVLGALLDGALGVPGLLALHSVASVLVAFVAWRVVPPDGPATATRAGRARIPARVWLLAGASAAVNFSLTGLMLVSPGLLADATPGLRYEAALLLMVLPGGAGMFVAARLADRGHARAVGLASAGLLAAAPLAFVWPPGAWAVVVAGALFFLGHSSLSSLLPSLTSREADEGARGAAQGAQSTLQYFGSFAGSVVLAAFYPRALPLAVAFVAMGLVVALALGVVASRGRSARA